MSAARAVQAKKAKQKCRKCGKNHFPFCKPSGKRPPRGGGRDKDDPPRKDKKCYVCGKEHYPWCKRERKACYFSEERAARRAA